ncbi:hypothetical protein BLA29_014887, partial [Euroglyphus maynei]
ITAGKIWSEFSEDFKENINDLINLFIQHKYQSSSESDDFKVLANRLRKKFIKKLHNDRNKTKKIKNE